MQASPADTVGDDIGGPEVAVSTVGVERKIAERAVGGGIYVHRGCPQPLLVQHVERLSLQLVVRRSVTRVFLNTARLAVLIG